MTLEKKIEDALVAGPLRASEIGKQLGLRGHDVLAVLQELQQARRVVQDPMSMRWELAVPPVVRPPAAGADQTGELAIAPQPVVPESATGEPWPWHVAKASNRPAPERPSPPAIPWEDQLDQEKKAVVWAPKDTGTVVEAPPGCGKTYAACARAAALCRTLRGPNILFVSFTRIAVREVRDRIESFMPTGEEPKVWTIDQLAYRLAGERESFDYDATVKAAIESFGTVASAADQFFEDIDHIIVDEAQDIVGVRATFINKAIEAVVGHGGGFTVFHDPAQAIYDWSEDRAEFDPATRLVDLLTSRGVPYNELKLTKNYRSSVYLQALFTNMRRYAVNDAVAASQLDAVLTNEQIGRASDLPALLREVPPNEKVFVLFRSRMEAIEQSWRLANEGIRHGLRFGGTPHYVPPWIAAVFNTIGEADVSWAEFDAGWQAVPNPRLLEGYSSETAWLTLQRLMGGSRIDVRRLAEMIGRSIPPAELARRPIGDDHIVLGTIHGVKGREADRVFLVHPQHDNGEDDARVWFVGVTRARDALQVIGGPKYWSRTAHGRPWRKGRNGGALTWIGQRDDVHRVNGLGVRTGEPNAQTLLASYVEPFSVTCRADSPTDYLYRLRANGEQIGELTNDVNMALFAVKKGLNRYRGGLGEELYNVRVYDVVTESAPATAVDDTELKEPFRTTRLWLKPAVAALSKNYL